MPTIRSLRIIRPVNCLLAAIAVWIGARQFAPLPFSAFDLFAAAVSAFAACGFGNIRNDLVDLPADRINTPDRVLAKGELAPPAAARVAVLLAILSIAAAVCAGFRIAAVTLVALLALELYNRRLKWIAGIGHLIVATLGGLPLFTGALLVPAAEMESIPGWMIPSLFAFLLHLARELAKAAQDIPGDRAVGLRNLPDYAGPRLTLSIILILLIGLATILVLCVWPEWYSFWFYVIATASLVTAFVPILLALTTNASMPNWSAISTGLKVAMFLGLLALAIK